MDRRIYEFVDGWATYFQTKRGWNLARAKVWCQFSALISSLAWANMIESGRLIFLIVNAVFVGVPLWSRIKAFKDDGDYPDSLRKCERLNARAVYMRENHGKARIIWLWLFGVIVVAIIPVFSAPKDACWIVWAIAITLGSYLDCCLYLGPGQHSRELNKKEATNAATERSS